MITAFIIGAATGLILGWSTPCPEIVTQAVQRVVDFILKFRK